MIEGTGPRMCVCVSLCVKVFLLFQQSAQDRWNSSLSNKRWWWWCAKAFNIKQWYISRVFWTWFKAQETCAAMWKTDRQLELPNNDHRIKKSKAWIKWTGKCWGWSGISSKCSELSTGSFLLKGSDTKQKNEMLFDLILQRFKWVINVQKLSDCRLDQCKT